MPDLELGFRIHPRSIIAMIRSRLVNVFKQESFDIILIGITMTALVALVTAFVISRDGNLTWDDSQYLLYGLKMARWTEKSRATWMKPLWAIYFSIGGSIPAVKPPLLYAWIAQSWLLFGDHSITPVLVSSTVIPFGLLALGVVAVAWRTLRFTCGPAFAGLPGCLPRDAGHRI